MRYVVDEKALPRGRARRSTEPAAVEFANLYAAIGETLRHFDEQIRAAEQELETLRVLRNLRTVASELVLDQPLNDNRRWIERHFMNLAVAEASSLDEDEAQEGVG
jgi:hypothetical protein